MISGHLRLRNYPFRLLLVCVGLSAGLSDIASAQFPSPGDLRRRAEREARKAAEQAAAKALFPLEEDGAELYPTNAWLDDYKPRRWGDMATLRRTKTGGFILQPGAWRITVQSYCLNVGSYERPGGAGYQSGPITGKVAPYVRTILARSYGAPDVAQRDIQLLLWSALAGVHVRDMNARARAAAAALLTPREIRDLNGGIGTYVPPRLTSRALGALPAPVRRAHNAIARLRRVAANPNSTYADFERIAVDRRAAPRTDDDIPAVRWSWHPDGYYIRYHSRYYKRTTVEIMLPEGFAVRKDRLGRIVEWRFSNGNRVRTSYMDGPPLSTPAYPEADIWRFAKIEIRARDKSAGVFRTRTYTNEGFTFVVKRRSRRGAIGDGPARHVNAREAREPLILARTASIPALENSPYFRPGREARERYNYYRDRWERGTSEASEEDVNDLTDLDHYRDGLETVRGSRGDRLEWLIEHQETENRSLRHATNILDGLPTHSDDGYGNTVGTPTHEPSRDAAHPGTGGFQRRGTSGRGG